MKGFNLLPWRHLERKKSKNLFYLQVCGSIILAFICIGIIHFFITLKQQALIKNIHDLTAKMENYSHTMKLLNKTKDLQQQTAEQILLITQLKSNSILIKRFFEILAKTTPPTISLQHITFDKTAFTITGRSANNDDVYQFLESLKSQNFFSQAEIKEIKTSEVETNPSKEFILELNLKS